MARNLKYQLKNCVDKNFKPGMDKHSDKKNKVEKNKKIYGYSDRKNLIDFTANFANFMKINYSNVKMVKDINSEHAQSFLNEKSKMCTRATLEQYTSKLNKMCNLVNLTYKGSNLKFDIATPVSNSGNQIIRDKQITKEHYELVKENIRGNGLKGIELSRAFGLRVSEITKLQKRDIDLKNNIVRVKDGKGGRDRSIPISTPKQLEVAQRMLNSVRGDEFQAIVPVTDNAVNMAFTRALEKVNLKEEYNGNKIHSVRKLYAQETFDRYREDGYNIESSLGKVSKDLGHSEERGKDKDLINRYIKDIK